MKALCYLLALLAAGPVFAGTTNASSASVVRGLGVAQSYGEAAWLFDRSVNLADLQQGGGHFLAQTISQCRSNAAAAGKSPQQIGSLGGSWLEWAVLVALKEKGFRPLYSQAEFAVVPDAFNDVMLWSREFGPIIISCKTSLRERYKQADLEAVALRERFPKGKFYLVTLDEDQRHLENVRNKIVTKEILALQAVYAPDNIEELFSFLKSVTLEPPPAKTLGRARLVK